VINKSSRVQCRVTGRRVIRHRSSGNWSDRVLGSSRRVVRLGWVVSPSHWVISPSHRVGSSCRIVRSGWVVSPRCLAESSGRRVGHLAGLSDWDGWSCRVSHWVVSSRRVVRLGWVVSPSRLFIRSSRRVIRSSGRLVESSGHQSSGRVVVPFRDMRVFCGQKPSCWDGVLGHVGQIVGKRRVKATSQHSPRQLDLTNIALKFFTRPREDIKSSRLVSNLNVYYM
jgi:hypothetical protein